MSLLMSNSFCSIPKQIYLDYEKIIEKIVLLVEEKNNTNFEYEEKLALLEIEKSVFETKYKSLSTEYFMK